MDRIYRLRQAGTTFHAVERDGDLRLANPRHGDIFSGYELGESVPGGLREATVLAPVMPSKLVCVASTTATTPPR